MNDDSCSTHHRLPNRRWQIWIDTGGTFTDCIAIDPAHPQNLLRAKVLSSSSIRARVAAIPAPTRLAITLPHTARLDWLIGMTAHCRAWSSTVINLSDDPTLTLHLDTPVGPSSHITPGTTDIDLSVPDEPAPILAARLVTATPVGQPLPPMDLRLATTRGTNALLQQKGAPTALFITRGFADLLRIGTQQRPNLFALEILKPDPLYTAVSEVPERCAHDSTVITPLDLDPVRQSASRLVASGIRTAAVALMHSTANPDHERAVAACLLESGFEHVSISHEVAPMIRLLQRAETTVVNATLSPVIEQYLHDIEDHASDHHREAKSSSLHVMTSAGGLVGSADYRPKDSLLSGPAGGVAGAAAAAERSGYTRIISFDMGGTSTDVSRYDGDFEYVFEHTVGHAHLLAPALAIETVAAGGGSICWFDGQALRVGPDSAGADPGPACYGRAGPLTMTDVNLLLGRLDPEHFGIPIDPAAARARFDELLAQLTQPTDEINILNGLVDIANERMANAIRKISAQRGYDPADYALVAFGGAGGQHACGVASRLGIKTIIIPPDAGLLSADGLGRAVIERFAQKQLLTPLADITPTDILTIIEQLGNDAVAGVRTSGGVADDDPVSVRRCIVNMRLVGQDTSLSIDVDRASLPDDPVAHLSRLFVSHYQQVYGHMPLVSRDIELESIRIIASTAQPEESSCTTTTNAAPPTSHHPTDPFHRVTRACMNRDWCDVNAYDRRDLPPGTALEGPALILEPHASTVVEAGWSVRLDQAGAIILSRGATHDPGRITTHEKQATIGPVELELFTCRFESLAEEMGEMLRRTAVSVNVKERLDFSCALLDPAGEIVANAKHIPVHLGSLGLCVRTVRDHINMQPGDVIITNHPAFGGSHLPDITIITPVYDDDRTNLLGYLASRAHHAEIGGIAPGSMPPSATSLAQEGIVIAPIHLRTGGGEPDWNTLERILTTGSFPTRALHENLADIAAAVAANHRGAITLRQLASLHGHETTRAAMAALKDKSEQCVRTALGAHPDGRFEAVEHLDDGTPIRICITITRDTARFDFTGTGTTHPGNLNGTPAIVHSAVMYVLRLLINEPLPLNEGFVAPIEIILPDGCLLNPTFDPRSPEACPAVAGGNVETSQRLVDTLLKALNLAACSQGTMNNVIFGNAGFGYYETICGGSGAGPTFDGADAVHTHMTNTCITDPEVVEHRYPVRIERFAIRRDSGGRSRFTGGDGVIREFHFLEPVSLSLLTQHRAAGPYGMAGGQSGQPGLQYVTRAGDSSRRIELTSIDGCELNAGDRLTIMTPGGGGWGKPKA